MVLTLSIFTHVVTCAPCYDDDVCASARIDGADQLSTTHIAEIGVAAEKDRANFSLPQPFGPLALAESMRDLQPLDSPPFSLAAASTSAKDKFSHPRTDVLLI